MAWDSKSTRRRGNSVATNTKNLPLHTRQQSRSQVTNQSNSQHLSDSFLQDFLSASFDPAEYLNAILPPLKTSSSSSSANQGAGAVPLSELLSQTNMTTSQLNAHTTRLTTTLTQLTDDILRSGSRLAYEVELLRGETLGLAESLTEGLSEDVVRFVPGGISADAKPAVAAEGAGEAQRAGAGSVLSLAPSLQQPEKETAPEAAEEDEEPPYITQLRTLTLVRSRLESVIKTFGEAMEFVFPPSELSVGSSFLSVSAPDVGSDNSTEEKGRKVLQGLREEIDTLLDDRADPIAGVERAARRVEELKDLVEVWRGTSEEKGRVKFVEGLTRAVEQKHEGLLREMEGQGRNKGGLEAAGAGRRAEEEVAAAGRVEESKGYGGYALLGQLNKLRSGL